VKGRLVEALAIPAAAADRDYQTGNENCIMICVKTKLRWKVSGGPKSENRRKDQNEKT